MLNYIYQFPNPMEKELNLPFLRSENDISIPDLVVMAMKEFEAIENITITGYDIVVDPDKVDVNEHSVNINYKRKSGNYDIPKFKYLATNRVGEIQFHVNIKTNKNERNIVKKILIPIEYDGFYTLNNKKWKALWQLVDASTYSQKGKITMKSRMPIIVYKSKKRPLIDMNGEVMQFSTYSYALNRKTRFASKSKAAKVKFINPVMIFSAKIGLKNTIAYFGLQDVIKILPFDKLFFDDHADQYDHERYRYFGVNEIILQVDRYLMENVPFVGNFTAMIAACMSADFPMTMETVENTMYWTCRVGSIGSAHSKNLETFAEKGKTTMHMIERLLDTITQVNLRLPDCYKKNIYSILRWMILDFDSLKNRNNMDLDNKRIRKNEYIVMSSLGKKINENINKLIEKKSKSKLNTMDTLLELFNFGSDIIINGMRNIGDLVKSDELVNDMTMLQDLYFSAKGPNSLGEQSSKIISQKYRNIHPSYLGKIDLNVSSNSDVGMSGAFTPFMELFDNFYFNPNPEPCDAGYHIHQEIAEYYNSDTCQAKGFPVEISFDSLGDYLKFINEYDSSVQFDGLKYAEIKIVEKEDTSTDWKNAMENRMKKVSKEIEKKVHGEEDSEDVEIPSEELNTEAEE